MSFYLGFVDENTISLCRTTPSLRCLCAPSSAISMQMRHLLDCSGSQTYVAYTYVAPSILSVDSSNRSPPPSRNTYSSTDREVTEPTVMGTQGPAIRERHVWVTSITDRLLSGVRMVEPRPWHRRLPALRGRWSVKRVSMRSFCDVAGQLNRKSGPRPRLLNSILSC